MTAGSPAAAVAVIGTGTMGSALARALLRAGHVVTVWNRTAARARPLGEAGARVAGDLVDAIAAADAIVTCVASPAIVTELLERPSVLSALAGRTVVQLTTGTPAEIRRGAASARRHEIVYLGGAILAHPRAIGTSDAVLLYGGDETAYERQRPWLSALGTTRYLGDDAGAPAAMDAALIAFFYGAMAGFVHGAKLTRAEGIDVRSYLELARPFLGSFVTAAVGDLGERIMGRDYSAPQSSMETHLGGIDALVVGSSRDAGIEPAVMAAIRDAFAAAVRAGHGAEDIACLFDFPEAPARR